MSEELLDNQNITNHKTDIIIYNGMSFSGRILLIAIVLLIAGFAITTAGGLGFILGPALIFASGYVLTSRHGVDISLKTKYIREYHQIFFFYKTGKWLPMSIYSDICILKISRSTRVSDYTGAVSTDLDVSKNEVFLMTHDHRHRILVKICNSYKEAKIFSEEMAEKLNKKIAVYNPKLSDKTKNRLKQRR